MSTHIDSGEDVRVCAVLLAVLVIKRRQWAKEVERSAPFAGGRVMVGHVVSEMCKGYK